jgi:hypothetical protein
VYCLLHLPIEGTLLDLHDIIINLMVTYLGASHCAQGCSCLVHILEDAPAQPPATCKTVSDDSFRPATYLLFVVGTTIFSNKAKNYVDLTYLLYLRDLELVNTFVWGPAALSFLFKELRNATVPKWKYLAG